MMLGKENSKIFYSKATVRGKCGDSITTKLYIKKNIIINIKQTYNGCGYTKACAKITSSLAKNLSLEKALDISPKTIIEKILNIPEDHFHCARLAVNSLGEAINNYYFIRQN